MFLVKGWPFCYLIFGISEYFAMSYLLLQKYKEINKNILAKTKEEMCYACFTIGFDKNWPKFIKTMTDTKLGAYMHTVPCALTCIVHPPKTMPSLDYSMCHIQPKKRIWQIDTLTLWLLNWLYVLPTFFLTVILCAFL